MLMPGMCRNQRHAIYTSSRARGVSVRRLLLVICLFLSSAAGVSADHVVTPKSCTLQTVLPPATHGSIYRYAISGERSTRELKLCLKKDSGVCKTLAIHKFDIDCNGQRVAWSEIVKYYAGLSSLSLKGRIQGKLFVISQGSRLFVDYEPSQSSGGKIRVQLPEGYAPLDDVSAPPQRQTFPARINFGFVSSAKAAEHETAPDKSDLDSKQAKRIDQNNEQRPALKDGTDRENADLASSGQERTNTQPVTGFSYVPAQAASPSQASGTSEVGVVTTAKAMATENGWSTTVVASSKAQSDNLRQSMIATILGLALITSLVSGIGWLATQRILTLRARQSDPYQIILRREFTDLTRPDAQMCGELVRTCQELIEEIQARSDEINGAAPLRRVLLREVKSMEQFLMTTLRTSPEDPREWRRMRLRLQRVVTDLIRLKDIADSARRSLTTAREITNELPRDKQEAYEVLGANPEASERILKRLVDALRATWHPDLATSEDDRAIRNLRITQINVAWDLITEKRVD